MPLASSRRWLAVCSVIMAYLLIVLGGWVRATNSGLSCPDWPTCYGQWVLTPGEFATLGDVGYTYLQMMLEWSHRFIAGVVLGPMILVLVAMSWVARKGDQTGFRLSLAILAVLLIQAKLGAVTVLDANSPWSVAVHLSNALLLTALMILFAVRLSGKAPIQAPPVFAWSAAIATLLAVATMASAAMTSKMGAALACYEWPSCDGTAFLPDVSDDPGLAMHLAHRGLAAATGLAVLLLAALAWKSGIRRLKVLCTLAVAIICVQVSLGAGVILLEVPIPVAVAHQAVGVLLFIKLATITWLAKAGFFSAVRGERLAHAGL